jgi:tetrahydromethanopterin S-methyltransferase subunit B
MQPALTLTLMNSKLVAAVLLLSASPIFAQVPKAPGVAKDVSISLGYSYVNLSWPASDRVAMSGVDASLTWGFSPKLALYGDFGYARKTNIADTGHHADILNYMAGPAFYLYRRNRWSISTHGLIGAARLTGQSRDATHQAHGYVNQFAWGFGGGVDFQVSRSFAIRGGTDYLHTKFFNPLARIDGQNDLRAVIGATYFFTPGRR